MRKQQRAGVLVTIAVGFGAVATAGLSAQGTAPQPNFQMPGGAFNTSIFQPPPMPPTQPITANASVVEDVIVRVNDQVITRTEYERSQQQLVEEAKQEKMSLAEFDEKQRDLLRDMIDQQLLLSKGKELGIDGSAETMRELDEIRKRANLPDMDALQKAAEQQGVSFEDFKRNIRNQAITQQVVRDEVGRHINITPSQEQAYYAAHAKDFEVPEQVHLSEILVTTPENATDAEISQAQMKADALEAKLKAGANFAELAKTSSGGPTAPAGGDLGDFKRGALGSDVLENATFNLPVGQVTAPIRTRQGFVILRVDGHQAAGTPPLEQVENKVQEAIYMDQLGPALRNYLTQAREDAYVKPAPGFVDTGSAHADSRTAFTTYAPPPLKKKVVRHQQAEQEKAARAEQELAEAREKLAAKQATRAAATGGGTAAASSPRKLKKVHREKVRYGQAPRNALPAGSRDVAAVPSLGAAPADPNKALGGEAPGAAMGTPTESTTTISTGTAPEEQDPFAPKQAASDHKTRFASRQTEASDKKAEVKLASAEVKVSKRPTAATPEERADEKVQAAPLGLVDTTKKQKKKRDKDAPKERLQEKPKTDQAQPTVAPTVNSNLGTTATGTEPAARQGTKPSDQTTLPTATPTPNNPAAPGQPIPAVTSASPSAPNTAPQPPQ